MSDFSLCIGCPFDDPDFGCLRSPYDVCRLSLDVSLAVEPLSDSTAEEVLFEEVSFLSSYNGSL